MAPSCTDANGNPMTYSIVDQPAHGTASVVAGQLHYVPTRDYTGADSFTYKASDGYLDSNTATVAVTVTAAASNFGLELRRTATAQAVRHVRPGDRRRWASRPSRSKRG